MLGFLLFRPCHALIGYGGHENLKNNNMHLCVGCCVNAIGDVWGGVCGVGIRWVSSLQCTNNL